MGGGLHCPTRLYALLGYVLLTVVKQHPWYCNKVFAEVKVGIPLALPFCKITPERNHLTQKGASE